MPYSRSYKVASFVQASLAHAEAERERFAKRIDAMLDHPLEKRLAAAEARVKELEHGLVRLCPPGTCKVRPPQECTCIVTIEELKSQREQAEADLERMREAITDVLNFCLTVRDDFDHALGVSEAGARKVDRIVKFINEKQAALQPPRTGGEG